MADAAQGGLGGLGGFVSNLYSDLYNRQAAPDEVSYWANSGQDPSQLLDSFLGSQEYRQAALPVMYQEYLGRDADPTGLNYYMNSGQSLDDIASSLMGSDEAKVYLASDTAAQATPPPSGGAMGPDMPAWMAPFDWGDAKTPVDMVGKWYNNFAGKFGGAATGGNFAKESGINPLQPQTRNGLPDGTPYLDKNGNYLGWGLAQVGGPRLNGPDPNNGSMGLNDFAKIIGIDPNTTDPAQATELQLRHQLYEMQNGWLRNQNILNKMKNAKTLSDAVAIFGGPKGFERPREPVIPGNRNWTDRVRDAEILQQYFNGGLDSLLPDQKSRLMDWMSRSNPVPQVNPSIDTQQLGPNINMSDNSQTYTDPLANMPLNMPSDPSTALLGNQNFTPYTGNPTTASMPSSPDMNDWARQLGLTSPTFTTATFSSGGAQQPNPANPYPTTFNQGSNTPFLNPNLYPQTQPLPSYDFATPPPSGGGFSGVGV